VKICSVHTPSSNPRFKPARSLSLKRGVSFCLIYHTKYYLFDFSLEVLVHTVFNLILKISVHQQQSAAAASSHLYNSIRKYLRKFSCVDQHHRQIQSNNNNNIVFRILSILHTFNFCLFLTLEQYFFSCVVVFFFLFFFFCLRFERTPLLSVNTFLCTDHLSQTCFCFFSLSLLASIRFDPFSSV
jgi:hypothetical protein